MLLPEAKTKTLISCTVHNQICKSRDSHDAALLENNSFTFIIPIIRFVSSLLYVQFARVHAFSEQNQRLLKKGNTLKKKKKKKRLLLTP